MKIIINPTQTGNPPGRLAEAELHFSSAATNDGYPDPVALDGLKLIGFGIWERRDGKRNVTFPARSYSVNGERRSFALLRPIAGGIDEQKAVRDAILDAYAAYEQEVIDNSLNKGYFS